VRARLPAVQIDAVEIDPVVARLARDYFGLVEDDRLQVHVEDGVEFIARIPHAYDYILLDAYDADAIPEALATAEFFRSVRAKLAPGGVAVANLSIRSDRAAGVMIRRMARQFSHCLHLRSPPHYNDVILLAQQPLPRPEALREAARRFEAESSEALGLDTSAATARACAL
jgi:spermidine synthase